MKLNKTYLLITASSIAVIALICIQINWINTSKQFMEETFNQKVCMALCSSAEESSESPFCGPPSCKVMPNSCENAPGATLYGVEDEDAFHDNLKEALAYYQIDLPYTIEVEEESAVASNPFETPVYSCSSHTSTQVDDKIVSLTFPEKDAFLLRRLGWMLVASVLILLFISSLFIWANYQLWQQKRQTEINIDFFNNMAHEFRTPLTNIGLAANRLAKKEANLKENPFLKIVKKESEKLMSQIERVLHIAKVENGDYTLLKEKINLKDLLENVVADMQMQIQNKEGKVLFDKLNGDLNIVGDPLHLSNVFKNLIDNSLKYSKLSPEVVISSENHAEGILLKFRDNGIGISKADQQMIFEKFQRVNTGNDHSRKGFGLGLAYVKMIIEKHCGKVKLSSDVNKGSRFDLYLPVTSG